MGQDRDPATKGDIAELRTELKSDIAKLDQKLEATTQRVEKLEGTVQRLVNAVVDLQTEVRGIKETIATLATKDDIYRLISSVDAFAGQGEKYDRTAVLHGHVLVEVETKLKNHEKRLKVLESSSR